MEGLPDEVRWILAVSRQSMCTWELEVEEADSRRGSQKLS